MNKIYTDDLAVRCKALEQEDVGSVVRQDLPILARLDGRTFRTFTRDLSRPYDPRLGECMIDVTKHLVDKTHAVSGYTQSDEITLIWGPARDESKLTLSEHMFGGKIQKMVSVLAGMASARLIVELGLRIPGKVAQTPHFDARIWQVYTPDDVVDVVRWRHRDAIKNSIAMGARAVFSHRDLHEKSTHQQYMMLKRAGVSWLDYPAHFRHGTLVQRVTVERTLTAEELTRIPAKHRPAEGTLVTRHHIQDTPMPYDLDEISNLRDVLLCRELPVMASGELPLDDTSGLTPGGALANG